MLWKGIIFLALCALFISRLIPKYEQYLETNQVHLFGLTLDGMIGLLSLVAVAILAVVLLGIGITNVVKFFSASSNGADS